MAITDLQAVADITRQRDQSALEWHLAAAVADAAGADSVMVLRRPSADTVDDFEVAVHMNAATDANRPRTYTSCDEPATIERDDALVQCIERNQSLSIHESGQQVRTLISTLRSGRIDSVVMIISPRPLDERLQTLEVIVEIFNNQQSLISDFERDSLTGLLNRRAFDTRLTHLLSAQKRAKETLVGNAQLREKRYVGADSAAWLAILDIDHFKLVNDTFGHLFGDEVILTVAQKMREYFRNTDLLFRFGGEGFIAILEPTPPTMAQLTLERFRRQIANHKFPQLGRVTISIGYTRLDESDYPAHILECADQALYYAKAGGRNRVCEFADLVKRGRLRDEQLSGSIELY